MHFVLGLGVCETQHQCVCRSRTPPLTTTTITPAAFPHKVPKVGEAHLAPVGEAARELRPLRRGGRLLRGLCSFAVARAALPSGARGP